MFGMNEFHVSASGAIQGHHGPLVYIVEGGWGLLNSGLFGKGEETNGNFSPHPRHTATAPVQTAQADMGW